LGLSHREARAQAALKKQREKHAVEEARKKKNVHYASWEDSRYSKGERTMKVKVKSCC
jgi:hypothetical protein